jgi:hypothetical protein
MPKYKLFRVALFLLFVNHGLIYFERTFEFEFIRK